MQEYVTDAVVLAKRASGEFDARYTLLTKKFGKMMGRAKSSRKITSKLAGHLEPGSVVKVRFIEKTGVQVVDALKVAQVGISLADLAALDRLIPEMEADAPLWEQILEGRFPGLPSSSRSAGIPGRLSVPDAAGAIFPIFSSRAKNFSVPSASRGTFQNCTPMRYH